MESSPETKPRIRLSTNVFLKHFQQLLHCAGHSPLMHDLDSPLNSELRTIVEVPTSEIPPTGRNSGIFAESNKGAQDL